jgi:hypothetical protein
LPRRGRKKLTLSAIDLFPRGGSHARSAERLRIIFLYPATSPEHVSYLLGNIYAAGR